MKCHLAGPLLLLLLALALPAFADTTSVEAALEHREALATLERERAAAARQAENAQQKLQQQTAARENLDTAAARQARLDLIAMRQTQFDELTGQLPQDKLRKVEAELAQRELALALMLVRTDREDGRLHIDGDEWPLARIREERDTAVAQVARFSAELRRVRFEQEAVEAMLMHNSLENEKLKLALVRLELTRDDPELLEKNRLLIERIMTLRGRRQETLQGEADILAVEEKMLRDELAAGGEYRDSLMRSLIDIRVQNLVSPTSEELGLRLLVALGLGLVIYLLKRLRRHLPDLLRKFIGEQPAPALVKTANILVLGAALIALATALAVLLGYTIMAYLILRRIGLTLFVFAVMGGVSARLDHSSLSPASARRLGLKLLCLLLAMAAVIQIWRIPLAPSFAALRDLSPFLLAKAFRIALLLGGLYVFLVLSRKVIDYILHAPERISKRETSSDREQRIRTLLAVYDHSMTVIVGILAVLAVLREIGIDIMPLVAGAGIAGIAIGLGAQSLVKDHLSGFFILFENQFVVGDVIRVGEISGRVESMGLRSTTLRDMAGVVHYIPNGEIVKVSNLTQEWAQAVLDVDVAYTENVDEVMALLRRVGREARADAQLGGLILDEPQVLGVEAFRDSSVTIRMVVKTQPQMHWDVARELRRRIKAGFDAAGIEMPLPQRVVYRREEKLVKAPPADLAEKKPRK